MTSYRNIFYHIIFRTKKSEKTINQEHEKELYAYLWGIIKNNNCKLYQIGGIENHIHLLIDLHPNIALSDLMRQLKASSSKWMKESRVFPQFLGWAEGYAAFTYSKNQKLTLINYIKNQKEHHRSDDFEQEYRGILKDNGVEIDERYFLKD